MCGLAGYANVTNEEKRASLTMSLGWGIDDRGGDAAGFLSLVEGSTAPPLVGRKLGHWLTAHDRFYRRATRGHTLLMHARFKTCGKGGISEAHPFEIVRNDRPVLWGAHNGIIWDADDSAKAHNRPYSVDSKELFELLADDELGTIQSLTGYGVITWVQADSPGVVYLARLSEQSDMHIVATECGATVWGSTKKIVEEGLRDASMAVKTVWQASEIGRVYRITRDGVYMTKREGVKVSRRTYAPVSAGWAWGNFDDERDVRGWDSGDDEYLDAWMRREEQKKKDAELEEKNEWMRDYLRALARDRSGASSDEAPISDSFGEDPIEWDVDDRVIVVIDRSMGWTENAVDALNWKLGTIVGVKEYSKGPRYLVEFDAPVEPWWEGQGDTSSWWFDPEELQLCPETELRIDLADEDADEDDAEAAQ